MKNTFLLLNNVISILDLFKILTYYIDDKILNNVISILDLFKILTYYIDDKKILEIRNYNINRKQCFFLKVLQGSFSKDLKK